MVIVAGNPEMDVRNPEMERVTGKPEMERVVEKIKYDDTKNCKLNRMMHNN